LDENEGRPGECIPWPSFVLAPRLFAPCLFALCLALFVVPTAYAAAPAPTSARASDVQQSRLCADAVAAAEQRFGIPHGLLLTMAKVESGRVLQSSGTLAPWPWSVDADGVGYFFDSKASAMAWVQQALDHGSVTYLDVGCLQVDLREHPKAFRDLDEAFDPAANVDYAARFLRSLRDGAGGNWFTAVGFYHSQTPQLAALYRAAVADVAAGRAPRLGVEPLYMRAYARGAVLLRLSAGHTEVLNTNRQPTSRHIPKPSPCRIAAVLGSFLSSPPRGCARRH
jgi:Transglycosylase SLT domain